jgi:sigma-B regulation protein RsbU (phosphoserine phosphatase)
LNELFPFGTATLQYATLVYGILDVKSGDFVYVSAAHPGPLYVPARGAAKFVVSPGFPIGLAEEAYRQEHIHLSPGDRLYLYSDGLTDAMSAERMPFGNDLLLSNLERERTKPLELGVAALLNEIAKWHGSERSQDDMSILAIEIAAASDRCGV